MFLLALLALATPALAGPVYPELFGSREVYSSSLKLFPKWRGTLARFEDELKSCGRDACQTKSWAGFIDSLHGLDRMAQLQAVQAEMNQKRYIIDPVNWNLPDYWATPFQFLRKNGDCEDYAISKYMALRELGVPVDDMRIVVLQDLNLQIAHAVLVVYVDGTAWVLDNQITTIVPADRIHHYQPVYSINESGWWLHRA
jgi:predicted transglutaminase-like cysteine proteinase